MSDNQDDGVTDEVVEKPRARRVGRGRSPMYPFFDLERSVARARQLYDREKVHATPVMTALKHWGYSNPSGKGGMTLSALKQFGLLEDVGRGEGRRVQLTTRAYDIINTPHEAEREQLLQDAALTPEIHQDLWEEFGTSLPSDSSLAWTLTKDRGFTSTGADDFIRQWKRTMDYAHLGDIVPQVTNDSTDGDESVATSTSEQERVPQQATGSALSFEEFLRNYAPRGTKPAAPQKPAVQSYPIPIALQGREPVIVSGPFPLSELEWTQFMAVLSAMKPVLAGAPAQEEPAHRQMSSGDTLGPNFD